MVWLGAAILIASCELTLAEQLAATPAEACLAVNRDISLGARLPRTSARLKSSERLSIVAVGSSSTVGLWVLRSGATYPEVMRQELARLRSNAAIEVINSGRVGDTIEGNVARFQRDVLSHRPDLVVWQLGTNDVAWGGHPDDQLKNRVVQGVQMLKASGADVVLIDLQYSPKVIAASETPDMIDQIAAASKEKNVDLFRRFGQMRDWHDVQHLPFEAFVSPDGLHMNDWGYACWAKIMSGAIAEAATRPVASAAAHAHPSH